ncbi:serine O-acetyltransferase [Fulvimarina manganoxydans]|uniref:Serine acetyltransferase n=1 Tax=Fulvimarina manganoxydans TaxID=937218 RepID=A0A1W2E382_9HYPH|nr:serine O-acetyltransferase [Fulvimarina manganoxydans]MCK5931860.1 serine O-acetyltransferase [Fulvimarina manganoxydans]MEE2952584.1 serine O-acetyltransferase [Pseudomonadota bacterium]SMD04183.1 serine O-acetyltransferase [Fulvimarina manganoxydans]
MSQVPLDNRDPIKSCDPIWAGIRREAGEMAETEPDLAGFVYSTVLNQRSFEAALSHRIAQRLDHPDVPAHMIVQAFEAMFRADGQVASIVRTDIQAVYDRDPATERYIEPLLYYKGFHAIETHRLAHWLWNNGRRDFALFLQSRSSSVFQTDIHPAARIGRGMFLDHATGLVVGFTAVIDDDVSILQDVTLGGTGKEFGDRHPKIGKGVLVGAGAKVLGNIRIGDCSKIAAGSVVLKEVPPYSTVAGVPAKVIATNEGCAEPSRQMDQGLER